MKQSYLVPALCIGLAGCAGVDFDNVVPRSLSPARAAPPPAPSSTTTDQPVAPPSNATTVDEFDTATDEEKTAAVAPAPTVPGGALGTAVASLGDPTTPGFWVETPLVSSETTGRVMSKSTGRTVKVTLKPASGSTRASLSALQLLDLDLSGLHELVIYGS